MKTKVIKLEENQKIKSIAFIDKTTVHIKYTEKENNKFAEILETEEEILIQKSKELCKVGNKIKSLLTRCIRTITMH